MRVPPQVASIRPTGEPSSCFSLRPKNQAAAENRVDRIEAGELRTQLPVTSSAGCAALVLATLNMRTSGRSAPAIASSEPSVGSCPFFSPSGFSMFDWPEASHTS